MKVSKEELMHIANLADLKISDDEVDEYLRNLDSILDYAEVIKRVPTEKLAETAFANDNSNVFRKDEVHAFEGTDLIMQNGQNVENNMFKIPKVID